MLLCVGHAIRAVKTANEEPPRKTAAAKIGRPTRRTLHKKLDAPRGCRVCKIVIERLADDKCLILKPGRAWNAMPKHKGSAAHQSPAQDGSEGPLLRVAGINRSFRAATCRSGQSHTL